MKINYKINYKTVETRFKIISGNTAENEEKAINLKDKDFFRLDNQLTATLSSYRKSNPGVIIYIIKDRLIYKLSSGFCFVYKIELL